MKRAQMSQAALGVLGAKSAKKKAATRTAKKEPHAGEGSNRIKTTLYLDPESYRILEKERYERRTAGDRKIDFSALVREALKTAFQAK